MEFLFKDKGYKLHHGSELWLLTMTISHSHYNTLNYIRFGKQVDNYIKIGISVDNIIREELLPTRICVRPTFLKLNMLTQSNPCFDKPSNFTRISRPTKEIGHICM